MFLRWDRQFSPVQEEAGLVGIMIRTLVSGTTSGLRAIKPCSWTCLLPDAHHRGLHRPDRQRKSLRRAEFLNMESLTALGSVVGSLLKERRQTLAIAESSAGGLITPRSSRCRAHPRITSAAASFIPARVVRHCWAWSAQDMANIRSTEAAKLLARRVRSNLGATWGLSETGASGPNGNRYGDAPGRACISRLRPRRGRDHRRNGQRGPGSQCGPSHAVRSSCSEPCLRKA